MDLTGAPPVGVGRLYSQCGPRTPVRQMEVGGIKRPSRCGSEIDSGLEPSERSLSGSNLTPNLSAFEISGQSAEPGARLDMGDLGDLGSGQQTVKIHKGRWIPPPLAPPPSPSRALRFKGCGEADESGETRPGVPREFAAVGGACVDTRTSVIDQPGCTESVLPVRLRPGVGGEPAAGGNSPGADQKGQTGGVSGRSHGAAQRVLTGRRKAISSPEILGEPIFLGRAAGWGDKPCQPEIHTRAEPARRQGSAQEAREFLADPGSRCTSQRRGELTNPPSRGRIEREGPELGEEPRCAKQSDRVVLEVRSPARPEQTALEVAETTREAPSSERCS